MPLVNGSVRIDIDWMRGPLCLPCFAGEYCLSPCLDYEDPGPRFEEPNSLRTAKAHVKYGTIVPNSCIFSHYVFF